MGLTLNIDYDFYLDSLKRMENYERQAEALETALNCDIYGGPMKAYDNELTMWNKIFDDDHKMDFFLSFSAYYVSDEFAMTFDYDDMEEDKEKTYEFDKDSTTKELQAKELWDKVFNT